MSKIEFSGAMTALITPFDSEGQVDYEAFGQLVEEQIAAGIDALVPCGTTGESATMSHEEHESVVRFAVKTAAGRVPVLAGAGSNNTAEAIRLTKAAADAGAAGVLLVSPYYNKPTAEGLYQHYRAIGEASGGIPQMLYNVPGRTGREIPAETVCRLYELPFVVGLKEAGGSVDRVNTLVACCDIPVVSGDDSLTLPMMAVGARGAISVISNLLPAAVKELTVACKNGDYATARELHYKMLPIVRLLFCENNPMGIKTAMRLAGKPSGNMRLPLCEMEQVNIDAMSKALSDYGLKVS
jgi:4-hydroxy-tetrahydrodipicolinate synthase